MIGGRECGEQKESGGSREGGEQKERGWVHGEAGCTEMTTRERQWEKSSIGENNGPELLELYLHPKRE
jgi:hypothetical protein